MSSRVSTCTGKVCPFWRRYNTDCPNYIECRWVTQDGHEHVTKDCAPKRSTMMVQQLYNQFVKTQGSFDQMRNAAISVFHIAMNKDTEKTAGLIESCEETKLIEE